VSLGVTSAGFVSFCSEADLFLPLFVSGDGSGVDDNLGAVMARRERTYGTLTKVSFAAKEVGVNGCVCCDVRAPLKCAS
jgi:hypothetical protein